MVAAYFVRKGEDSAPCALCGTLARYAHFPDQWYRSGHTGTPRRSCPTDRNKEQEVECPITDTQAIESNPNDATAYLERGTAHFKASEFDSAIADFTKAIELKPNHASAYTNRGSAHYEKAEFDRAIADFTKAIELNPKLALAYSNLGWTYEAIGDEREAIAHYRKSLEFEPSLEAARDNLKLLGATPERQPFYRQTKPRN